LFASSRQNAMLVRPAATQTVEALLCATRDGGQAANAYAMAGTLLATQCRSQVTEGLLTRFAASPADVVGPATFTKERVREDVGPRRYGLEHCLELGVEAGPVTSVFFRPEEVHARSTKWAGRSLTTNRGRGVANHGVGFDQQDFFVAHLDDHRLAAVKTRGLDAD